MGFNSVTRLTAKILIKKKKAKNTYPQGISAIIYRWRAFNGIFVKLRKARASYTFFWSLSQEDLTITSENENPMSTVESSPTANDEKSFQSHPFSVNNPLSSLVFITGALLEFPYNHLDLCYSLEPKRPSGSQVRTDDTTPYLAHSNFQLSSQQLQLSWDPYPSLLPPL